MEFKFKTLIELTRYFKDEATCYDFLENQIWLDGEPACPHCGSTHVYVRKNRSKNPAKKGVREYKCAEKGCNRNFTSTVGTIFEGSKLPLQTWFAAIWLCTTTSKGISSVNLAEQLGITQKTAWFVLSRIREMLKDVSPQMLDGEVEVDETYIGGKEVYKHKDKKRPKGITGAYGKMPIVGMLQRKDNLRLKVLGKEEAKGEFIKPLVIDSVKPTATIYTDGFGAYTGLSKNFKEHGIVAHDKGEYVKGAIHTNNIEGFWAIFKRGLVGVYHFMSHKHLQRYCDEYTYRFVNRDLSGKEKFSRAIQMTTNARITYSELTKG